MDNHIRIVKQLKEMFPSLHEHFLSELCEAYAEDELDVHELVEVVLDFQSNQSNSNNQLGFNNDIPYPDQIVFDNVQPPDEVVALPLNDVSNNARIVNDKLVASSTACGTELLGGGTSTEADVNKQEENIQELATCQNGKEKEASHDVKRSKDSLEKETSTLVAKSVMENSADTNINESNSSETLKERHPGNNCEEQSAEFYIKYLWVEDEDCTDAIPVCEEVLPKCGSPSLAYEDSIDIDSTSNKANNTKKLLEQYSKNNINSDKLNLSMPENSTRVFNSCQRTRPRVWSRRSFDSITFEDNLTPRRPAFRSSKAKSNEWRLRKLLRQKKLSPRTKTEKEHIVTSPQSPFENEDTKFSFLTKVLPDADHEYLVTESQRISSQEELLLFVSKSLHTRLYPKLKPDEKKMMERFECSVEEFLLEIPDPYREFSSDKYIRTGYEENAEIYLKSRYKNLSVDVIKELCIKNKYNLTYICQTLDDLGLEVRPYGLDSVQLHHSPSVFFHQEVWFIEHKSEVQNKLDNAIQAALAEAELSVAASSQVEEVFECEICRDDVVDYAELATCDGPPGHLFCKSCVKRSAEIHFSEGETKFPCLVNCGGFIPLPTLKEVLTTKMYEKLMDNIQVTEIKEAELAGAEFCPFCHYVIICPEGDTFCCDRPSCMKKSCRICLKEDHYPETCDLFKNEDEETALHYIENEMSKAIMRECYKCHLQFVKEVGCNKMTCRCGAMMCYLCRKPVTDYKHFNGPGGDNYDRCELFSEEAAVHDRPVADRAQQAYNQLVANNPGLTLDRNKIIPK